MLGVVLGVVGGLVTVTWIARAIWWRRVRRAYVMGRGFPGGWHHQGWHHQGWHHKGWYTPGGEAGGHGFRGGALYRLFERLDASPAQERVIRDAFEKLEARRTGADDALKAARASVAAAMRADTLTPESLQELYTAHAAHLDASRDLFASTLADVHAALDPKQRETFAEAVAAGEFDGGLAGLFGLGADPRERAHRPFVRGRGFGAGYVDACC